MSTIIAIASGKGGVGKTLVTASLAIALQRRGHSVLAVDADMGLRNLDLMFGMQDDVLYDIGDVIKGRCRAGEAVMTVAGKLDFLAASQKHTWEKVDAPTYHYIVETLSKDHDYTLIDCPPGRGRAYKDATAIADRIFFVVEPTWSSMRDAARVMQFCNKRKRFNYDVLFNNFYSGVPGYVPVQDMLQILNPETVAGILPHDPAVHRAAHEGCLLHAAETPFMKALAQTVAYVEGGAAPDIGSLTALLPTAEGAGAEEKESLPVADEEEKESLGCMKALAVAELQKAAAILNGTAAEPEEEPEEDAADEDMPRRPRGLSLRRRRDQSVAWRHYRR